jgi:hypothetical protein
MLSAFAGKPAFPASTSPQRLTTFTQPYLRPDSSGCLSGLEQWVARLFGTDKDRAPSIVRGFSASFTLLFLNNILETYDNFPLSMKLVNCVAHTLVSSLNNRLARRFDTATRSLSSDRLPS